MKPFYQSRTLWVNLLAAVALFTQQQYGYVIDPATQGLILTVLNMVLRFNTDSPVYVKQP